jgi:prepilin-type N-terminal cleavage/methylation domain-containing protein
MKIMKKSSAGFTLIEVIASLVVMTIVGAVAAMGLVQGIKAYVTTRTSSETIQQAEYALNRLKLEFMNMDTVTAAGADTITFKTDKINGSAQGTLYTFTRTGNEIDLTVTPPAGAASTNPLITGLGTYGAGSRLFTYFNNACTTCVWVPADGFGGTRTCTSSSLHSITINLIITRSDGGGDLTFTTSVNPRNNECANGPQAISVGQ